MTINILDIIPDTVVDGPHMRTSIYVSGCFHHCCGCHNPESWKYGSGRDYTVEEAAKEILSYGHKYITISGGDPFCYQSKECVELIKSIKEAVPDLNIWIYTGYTLEEIETSGTNEQKELLSLIDGLVDGKFVESLKSKDILFRGSTNQHIYEKEKSSNTFILSKYD